MNFLQRTHTSLIRPLTQKLIRVFSQKGMVQRKEITFRLAESRDFDAAVELSEGHYNGYDYLPVVFHDWLEMDNLDIMLAHLGKKLVGLGACIIVDDAKTFVLIGGRVMPELRGRGVSQGLIKVLEDHVRQKFPKVSRERLVTSSHLDSRNLWRKVLEYNTMFYDVREKPFHGRIPTEKVSAIESCSKEHFSKIILFSPVTRRLLPNDVLIVDWNPYEPLQSNMDYILGGHDLHFFVEKCKKGADPVSFSHGIHGRRAKRVEWLATIYTDDPDLFEGHILHQFKYACELIKGQFTFSVQLQHTMSCENEAGCVQRVLGGVLKLEGNTDHICSNETVKLYERDFN